MTVKTRSTIAKKIEKEADAPEAQYLAVNPDEIIQLQEESKKIPYKREIVWRNVALFAALHFGAAIGLYQLIFEAKWATVLFSESFLHSLFLICYQTIGNSSFGEVVQTGIEFYNNLKNGNSPFNGEASSIMGSFVPFLANASTEAKTEFYAILPRVGNMTIAEFETEVNAWAAKYGLTEEVEAFNKRSQNSTIEAEEHANAIVMNLPNVLNNLKAISSDKNQTVVEMHTRMMDYVNSLDEDTQDIVFIFFRSLLPPQFKKSKCTDKGNFLTNIFHKASEYFGGNNTSTGSGSGNGVGFGSVGSFWNSFNGNGNGNTNGNGNGNEKPHPMIGMISNFLNKNNISQEQADSVMTGVQHDGGFASIQILPAANLNIGDASLASDAQIGLAVIDEAQVTQKANKKQQQQANKNKNKKKTTTISPPLAADANVALEVHAKVL
uniref:DUF148 domain-containing protein n=2 Tax=Caenorhabditis tropicalis TaxID=1561998 RepID=A0A1I7U7C1_9PELO